MRMIQLGKSSSNLLIEDVVIPVNQTISDLYQHVHGLAGFLDGHNRGNNIILTGLQTDHLLPGLQLGVIYVIEQAGKHCIKGPFQLSDRPGRGLNGKAGRNTAGRQRCYIRH